MASNPFTAQGVSITVDRKSLAASTPMVARGARWFWWIAALSLVNTVLQHSGSQTSFVIGLGFTTIADAFFQGALRPAAFVIDACALGFFVLMGVFAVRGHRWAFIAGGLAYVLDALIYLYFGDYMPMAFHAWALYWIISGGVALHKAIKSAETAVAGKGGA